MEGPYPLSKGGVMSRDSKRVSKTTYVKYSTKDGKLECGLLKEQNIDNDFPIIRNTEENAIDVLKKLLGAC
jgi:hypothetical protein